MKAVHIAANSMRRFLRDRTAVFFTIVLPVMIIFVVGNATSGFDDPVIPLGVVDEGGGALGAELVAALEREPTLKLEHFDDRDEVAKLVRRGGVEAGLAVPPDYDETLRSGGTAELVFFIDQTRGFPAAVRAVVSKVASAQGAELQAAQLASSRTATGFDDALAQARRTAELSADAAIGVSAQRVGRADEESDLAPGFSYQVPSNLVLWVFITSLTGSALLIQSRRLGVTRRALGTPTTARTILAGETLSRFATAGFQALFIFVAGTVLFGVSWGSPPAALLLIALFVAVGTSIGMLFGTIFSTPEQAGAIGAPLGIGAGMLGGCMWPLEIVPDTMRTVGHALPHAWAMDAWIELIGRGGGLADISTELAVLAAFVAVLFPLGAWRLRRAIVAG